MKETRIVFYRADGQPVNDRYKDVVTHFDFMGIPGRPFTSDEDLHVVHAFALGVVDIIGCQYRIEQPGDREWVVVK